MVTGDAGAGLHEIAGEKGFGSTKKVHLLGEKDCPCSGAEGIRQSLEYNSCQLRGEFQLINI